MLRRPRRGDREQRRPVLVTAGIEVARDAIARADFFGRAFALDQSDREHLHRDAAARLREEAAAWTDERVAEPARRTDSEG